MIKIPVLLSASQKAYVMAAAVCAGLILLVALVFLPLCGKLRQQCALLTALRAQAADGRVALSQLSAQETASAEAAVRKQALEQRLGKDQSIARILEALSRQAKAHHLELIITQPRRQADETPVVSLGPELSLQRIVLSAQLTGRYRYLGEFLAEVPRAPYVMVIESLGLVRPDSGNPKVRANLVLAVYLSQDAS